MENIHAPPTNLVSISHYLRLKNRLSFHQNLKKNKTVQDLVKFLQEHLKTVNPFIHAFKQAFQKLEEGAESLRIIIHANKDAGTHHKKVFAPNTNSTDVTSFIFFKNMKSKSSFVAI